MDCDSGLGGEGEEGGGLRGCGADMHHASPMPEHAELADLGAAKLQALAAAHLHSTCRQPTGPAGASAPETSELQHDVRGKVVGPALVAVSYRRVIGHKTQLGVKATQGPPPSSTVPGRLRRRWRPLCSGSTRPFRSGTAPSGRCCCAPAPPPRPRTGRRRC
jgi:hypothetical protein